jgi:hypothetical protein
MKKSEIIMLYIKNLEKKGSSKKLKDERKKRLYHMFDSL